ncbi:hypothetical protein [Planctomyces sp. SH-PL14]|uniref:hypothetical protein n=1 Tax=Planctomyces sp. SH-PL14 TaxID=1632864 RepID=UPI00078B9273|nr:hypothetical protein [Planctomyces sp. SH-PL14]AMV18033.1 hypothetical protein VT03_09095 [Planctomyces sp. SH-PL14]
MPKPLTTKQQAFLTAYRTYGIVRIAAAKSGVSRGLHYNAGCRRWHRWASSDWTPEVKWALLVRAPVDGKDLLLRSQL